MDSPASTDPRGHLPAESLLDGRAGRPPRRPSPRGLAACRVSSGLVRRTRRAAVGHRDEHRDHLLRRDQVDEDGPGRSSSSPSPRTPTRGAETELAQGFCTLCGAPNKGDERPVRRTQVPEGWGISVRLARETRRTSACGPGMRGSRGRSLTAICAISARADGSPQARSSRIVMPSSGQGATRASPDTADVIVPVWPGSALRADTGAMTQW